MKINEIAEALNKKVLPVVSFVHYENAEKAAEFLRGKGINVIEVTFRNENADKAISNIKKAYPDMIVGAGTVLTAATAKLAIECGADFIVAPGFSAEVVKYCLEKDIAVIPGVETATEIELAMSYGLEILKLFPAEAVGGLNKLKAYGAPYKNIKFMPTGGITEENAVEYLKLKNVICCGGSYILPKELC